MPSSTSIKDLASDIYRYVVDESSFTKGFVVGGIFVLSGAQFLYYLTSQERKLQVQINLNREKLLYEQIEKKDSRINALHNEVGKLVKKGKA